MKNSIAKVFAIVAVLALSMSVVGCSKMKGDYQGYSRPPIESEGPANYVWDSENSGFIVSEEVLR
jgi:hypothetical protein